MVYIFIDESGDIGNPAILENSKDFSLAACVCDNEKIDYLISQIKQFNTKFKKKEMKFSKFSKTERVLCKKFLKNLTIKNSSVYRKKSLTNYGDSFLKSTFQELINNINISTKGKLKVFIDGTENAHFRKIYEPILRKKFPKATLQFANSIKTPLVQVADFYAGYRRRIERI